MSAMQATVAEIMQKLQNGLKEVEKPNAFVLHLSKKADLLLSGADCGMNAVQYEDSKTAGLPPITDIGVTWNKNRIPQGWELLAKSVSNKLVANVNKGNNRQVYLCYHRAPKGSKQRPITGLGVVFKNISEEPALGFQAIDKTVTGDLASLNGGAGNYSIYLCVHRGNGAPIQDISVIFPDKKEVLPPGFHAVKHTPFGNKANLNSGTEGDQVYLCFRPDCQPILDKFEALRKDQNADIRLAAQCVSVLVECFYSYNSQVVCCALEAFRKVPNTWPSEIMNTFVNCLCDASACFNAYFTSKLHTLYMKSQQQIFHNFLHSLTVPTILRIFETCFLIRHEDKKLDTSLEMLDYLLESSFRSIPCKCFHKVHKKWPPADGPPCWKCVKAQADEEAPNNTAFCKRIVQGLVNNVRIAGRIELDAVKFGRLRSRPTSDPDNDNDRFDFAQWAQTLLDYDSMASSNFISMPQDDGGDDPDGGVHDPDKEEHPVLQPLAPETGPSEPEEEDHDEEVVEVPEETNGDTTPVRPKSPQLSPRRNESELEDDTKLAVVTNEQKVALQPKIEQTLFATTMLLCKFTTETTPFKLKKSERVKRKLHAVGLLLHLLEKGRYFFHSRLGSVYLIRRFVCSSLMVCGVTDVSLLFKDVLKAFVVLYQHYQDILLWELGVFLDHIFLKLLDHPLTNLEIKKDIIDVFLTVFDSPQTIVNLFYNYDNRHKAWPIFEKIVTVVSKIVEGDFQAQQATMSQQLKQIKEKDESKEKIDELARAALEANETALVSLQKLALRFLVKLLQSQAQWLGVPDLPGSRSAGDEPSVSVEEAKEMTPENVARLRRVRAGTWCTRWDTTKDLAKVHEKALSLARVADSDKSLYEAIKYLKVTIPTREIARLAVMQEIAKFLLQNDTLDKRKVGDVLSQQDDKIFNAYEYTDLRREYVKLLDFTNLTFDEALRSFLIDSNFRLPGESQKIERLLDMFSEGYCRDNPGVFTNASSKEPPASQAAFLAFAIMLLHTDAWNPNVARKMTKEQFIDLCNGGKENKYHFGDDLLSTLYHNITTHQFADITGKKEEKTDGQVELTDDMKLNQWKGDFLLFVRKAHARLRQVACELPTQHTTFSAELTRATFEVSWYKFVAAIIAQTQPRTNKPSDIDVLHLCLDGLSYGACVAILLGLETENKAFAMQLAKIIFVERSKKEGTGQAALNRKLMSGEHLKQEWYRPLNLQSEKHPGKACKVVLKVTRDIKQVITDERRQAILRRIQAEFGGDICLSDSNRSFVKEGVLLKAADQGAGKRQEYLFMLFSDLLLYASEGMQTKYKVHRVMHLSLCRLVDVQDDRFKNSFKLVSPQKSVMIVCPSEKSKREWLEAVLRCLTQVMAERKAYIASLDQEVKVEPRASKRMDEDEEVLRRYSTFIGHTSLDLFSDKVTKGKKEALYCKLCVKGFGLMRRRMVCKWCRDTVCVECCQRKKILPTAVMPKGGKKPPAEKVCDACFGALSGMVGDAIPLLSISKDGMARIEKLSAPDDE